MFGLQEVSVTVATKHDVADSKSANQFQQLND
jgi:hypothetical protein